jgi:serine/threonine protein kinase
MAPSHPAGRAGHQPRRECHADSVVTAGPEALVEALSGRYSLERELGRGGMATVYLARDIRHRRPVALKVMHPLLASALDGQRFLREIEVAASLSHPLIVPLHDSGSVGESLYYVMPYVEGESLYERLQRERRLPLDDALGITRDVALALAYAHGRGVLHRDVKPENILLAGGHALIADFGLARAIGTAEYRRLTETGVIIGSPYYLSPEQIREDLHLDERTDIYSLGCILYEMLTGEPPYTGSSLNQLIKRIITAPVPSAQRLVPTVPPFVDQAIAKALAKSADGRFATMQEFAAALSPRPAEPAADAAEKPVEEPAASTPTGPAGRGGFLGRVIHALRSLVSRSR